MAYAYCKIEIKNYGDIIPKPELIKFRNNMLKHRVTGINCGIFVSINQPIMGEYNTLGYQWVNGMLLLYFNLDNNANNMRYIINLALIVIENRIITQDEDDEELLIQHFKDSYIGNESNIKSNERMIKQITQTLTFLMEDKNVMKVPKSLC